MFLSGRTSGRATLNAVERVLLARAAVSSCSVLGRLLRTEGLKAVQAAEQAAARFNQMVSLLASLSPPRLTEVYLDSEDTLGARVDARHSIWAAVVFEEVPADGVHGPLVWRGGCGAP